MVFPRPVPRHVYRHVARPGPIAPPKHHSPNQGPIPAQPQPPGGDPDLVKALMEARRDRSPLDPRKSSLGEKLGDKLGEKLTESPRMSSLTFKLLRRLPSFRIANTLAQRISDGTYPAGERLPAGLWAEFSASPATYRAGLEWLESWGLVAWIPGKGFCSLGPPE
jgi:Bacterial regulatory proteins, gntR family